MKEGEQHQFNQYQQLLQQYNNRVTEYVEKQEDGLEEEERDDLCISLGAQFKQCDQQYHKLVERRELNRHTFQTICDNYCVSLANSSYSHVENSL